MTQSWDCDGQGNCTDPGNGNGAYASLSACQAACCACASKITNGSTFGPYPATNPPACDNSSIYRQVTTSDSSPWTWQIWETGIPGQTSGGTLIHEQINIPSGTDSNTFTISQGEYYQMSIDNVGCPISGCIGTGTAITVECTP